MAKTAIQLIEQAIEAATARIEGQQASITEQELDLGCAKDALKAALIARTELTAALALLTGKK